MMGMVMRASILDALFIIILDDVRLLAFLSEGRAAM